MGKLENWTYNEMSFVYVCLFRVIGIIPYSCDAERSNFRMLLRNYLPGIYCHVVNTIYYTMYVGHGVRIALQGELDVEYICEMVIVQGVYLRYLILYLHRNELMSLEKLCGELWLFLGADEWKSVRDFERKVYYLRNFFLWNTIIAVTFYIGAAKFIKEPSMYSNETARKALPCKFYVDVQDDFWYNTVFILQVIICYSIAVILTGVEIVGPFFIMMACGYLRVIQKRFTFMTNIPNDSGSNKNSAVNMDKLPHYEILSCIKFHQKIMEFCDKIEQITRSLFMVQVACTIYNMSLVAITLLENNSTYLKPISVFILNLLQFFTCQWISEHLLNESEAIANAAYTAALTHPVYEHGTNQMLLLMILRAEKPVQLTAGRYIKLSLETYERMCVNAFSFFTVLRSFSD